MQNDNTSPSHGDVGKPNQTTNKTQQHKSNSTSNLVRHNRKDRTKQLAARAFKPQPYFPTTNHKAGKFHHLCTRAVTGKNQKKGKQNPLHRLRHIDMKKQKHGFNKKEEWSSNKHLKPSKMAPITNKGKTVTHYVDWSIKCPNLKFLILNSKLPMIFFRPTIHGVELPNQIKPTNHKTNNNNASLQTILTIIDQQEMTLPDHTTLSVQTTGDYNNYSHVCAFDKQGKTDEGKFICAKLGAREAVELKKKAFVWQETIEMLKQASSSNTVRHKHHTSFNDFYCSAGLRLDQNGNYGPYALRSNLTNAEKIDLYNRINDISEFIYTKMTRVVPSNIICSMELALDEELRQNNTSRMQCAFRGRNNGQPSCFLQMSGGKNFWAAAHTDNDYTLSAVVAISQKALAKTKELVGSKGIAHRDTFTEQDVAFYFVFPEYGKAVPMRHGDVLFFNPSIVHCASRPQFDDVYSFALYTSQKTVLHSHRINLKSEQP